MVRPGKRVHIAEGVQSRLGLLEVGILSLVLEALGSLSILGRTTGCESSEYRGHLRTCQLLAIAKSTFRGFGTWIGPDKLIRLPPSRRP